jgi:predicted ATPase
MGRAHLKYIHPVNILSFGPDTLPIELRPLNVLIGPNGSGKSNLIESIRLLHFLPDKDPWAVIQNTGGAGEWLWKGSKNKRSSCSLKTQLCLGHMDGERVLGGPRFFKLSLDLERYESSFRVGAESIWPTTQDGRHDSRSNGFTRNGSRGELSFRQALSTEDPVSFDVNLDRSILAQMGSRSVQASGAGQFLLDLFSVSEFLESFDFHQDWDFGVDCPARELQLVGQSVTHLEEDGSNLAQMLAFYRDEHKAVFERLTELAKLFYEPLRSIEIRLHITNLLIAIEEIGGFSTPATRLSDGMLRWLAMLTILLNPTPAPVTCIDEPELGLHPDIIPTLADLLREASERTQLIVTTHSTALVDAFSDDPESICVCEKREGSTVIQRLNQEELKVWLKDYSLGSLWTSGQIGGNRW